MSFRDAQAQVAGVTHIQLISFTGMIEEFMSVSGRRHTKAWNLMRLHVVGLWLLVKLVNLALVSDNVAAHMV
jgi:hypothetical protein